MTDPHIPISVPTELGIIHSGTLTTLPLVSSYDAVGHNVENCEQEEANLKWQEDNLSEGFTMTVDESAH